MTAYPVLRRARAEDVPHIEALLLSAQLPTAGLRDHLDNFFVIEGDGRLLGSAGLEVYGEAALLRSVVVEPAQRAKGLGTLLTQAALDEARRCGIRRLYLFTMWAAAFFARFGFRPVPLADFEVSLRRSSQYRKVASWPALAKQLTAMHLELAQEEAPS